MAERAILHLDLDTFFVSVERLKNARLCGRPVIVGGALERGVVASCSYEARRFGVYSGMALKLARRLCPEAVFIRGNMADYSYYSRLITSILEEEVPVLEKASIDEFYADLTGLDRYYGCWKWATRLRKRILRESGLPISLGLSTSKSVAKIATGEAKPNNQLYVQSGREKPFLAPLPVQKIPGVGPKTHRTLATMGIRHIHTLQQMPPSALQTAFGKWGRLLWERANAIDPRPVTPHSQRKSLSAERTFPHDLLDLPSLLSALSALVEKLTYRLRQLGMYTGRIALKIRYADFRTFSQQTKVPYTAFDEEILPVATTLLHKLYTRRMGIRMLGIAFGDLIPQTCQLDFFDDRLRTTRLYQAVDALRNKYGPHILKKAASMPPTPLHQLPHHSKNPLLHVR